MGGVCASACVYCAVTVYAFEDQGMTLGFWIYRIGSLHHVGPGCQSQAIKICDTLH